MWALPDGYVFPKRQQNGRRKESSSQIILAGLSRKTLKLLFHLYIKHKGSTKRITTLSVYLLKKALSCCIHNSHCHFPKIYVRPGIRLTKGMLIS